MDKFDIEYGQFLLSKAYKLYFEIKTTGTITIVELKLNYETKEFANVSMYYFAFKKRNIKIYAIVEIQKSNELLLTLSIKGTDLKLILITRNFNFLDLSNILSSGNLTYNENTRIFITFHYPNITDSWKSDQLIITEKEFGEWPLLGIETFLDKFNNEGTELFQSELPII